MAGTGEADALLRVGPAYRMAGAELVSFIEPLIQRVIVIRLLNAGANTRKCGERRHGARWIFCDERSEELWFAYTTQAMLS